MASILTSKVLSPAQKMPLLEAGFKITEHDFIDIEPMEFSVPENVENAIFTSQKAPFALAGISPKRGKLEALKTNIKNCFCVGSKTKKLLEENGMTVIASAEYGKDLAEIIVEKYPNENFIFFCGNRRRDELPSILKKNMVSFEEIEVYKTILNPKKMEQAFDGILFFSPSGVESYIKGQMFENGGIPAFAGMIAFCIGTTTATEAKKYTEKVIVAEKPTIESVIELACKVLPKATL